MTGPEHYRESERLIEEANHVGHSDSWRSYGMVASAQVHATLALAAATALGREGEGRTMASKDRAAWFDAAAECRKAATA